MRRNRPSNVLYSYEELLQKHTANPRTTDQTCVPVNRIIRAFFAWIWQFWLAAQEFQLRLLRLGMDAEVITELHQMALNEARITNARAS